MSDSSSRAASPEGPLQPTARDEPLAAWEVDLLTDLMSQYDDSQLSQLKWLNDVATLFIAHTSTTRSNGDVTREITAIVQRTGGWRHGGGGTPSRGDSQDKQTQGNRARGNDSQPSPSAPPPRASQSRASHLDPSQQGESAAGSGCESEHHPRAVTTYRPIPEGVCLELHTFGDTAVTKEVVFTPRFAWQWHDDPLETPDDAIWHLRVTSSNHGMTQELRMPHDTTKTFKLEQHYLLVFESPNGDEVHIVIR